MLERLTRGKYVRLLSGVYLAMFLIRVAFGVVVVTFGRFMTDADPLAFGLLTSIVPTFELVTVVFAAIIVDRYGRKGVLLGGLALGAVSLYLLALAQPRHVPLIAVSQGLHGVAAGFILVTTLAIIAAYAPPETRGREMGLFNFANIFGWIAGSALGSFFLDVVGDMRFTFIVAGLLATFGLLYSHVNVRDPKGSATGAHTGLRDLRAVFGNRRVLVLSGGWLVVFLFIGGLIGFFSKLFVPAVPADPTSSPGTMAALAILGLGVLFMGSQIVFGKMSDRYGRELVMIVGAIAFLVLAITVILGVDVDLDRGFDPRFAFVTPVLVAAAVLSLAFAPAGLAALADEATERTEGRTMSAYSIVLNLGMIGGPIIVGATIRTFGASGVGAFLLVEGIALLGFVLVRLVQVRAAAVGAASGAIPGR